MASLLQPRPAIASRLLAWFDQAGRHDLPWKHPRDPYRIWVSEIMLQQTQVGTVLPYFERFMARFPTLATLADAPLDEVLQRWTGLGYYARARNLHRAARQLQQDFNGQLPDDPDQLQALPGIGRSTAGAIAAMAHDRRAPILDGNVRRVLARYHGLRSWPGERAAEQALWQQADAHTPNERVADYTQAIMDLGALLCTRRNPDCEACPLAADCLARCWQATDSIPAARPRRERPTRIRDALLIVRPDGHLWLEQRPPSGIWGGLWSFPEREAGAELPGWLLRANASAQAGHGPLTAATLPTLVHQFTHYRLELRPLLLRLPTRDAVVGEHAGDWFAPSGPLDIALAAPVTQARRKGLLQWIKPFSLESEPWPEP